MSLSEILEAVSKLTPAEKAMVAKQLGEKSEPDETGSLVERQEELNRALLAEGLVKRLPVRGTKTLRSKRIKIEGKPLSETIIEERR